MGNRVRLTNGILLSSVNGPYATTIVGGTQTRIVYVCSNSVASGFTLTGGYGSSTGDDLKELRGNSSTAAGAFAGSGLGVQVSANYNC